LPGPSRPIPNCSFDEALSGLTPREIDVASEMIARIRTELGKTIIVVEHVMRVIMAIGPHRGSSSRREDRGWHAPGGTGYRRVIEAYLGESA
jgi:hypothetical protein